jgi:hypothetical protein
MSSRGNLCHSALLLKFEPLQIASNLYNDLLPEISSRCISDGLAKKGDLQHTAPTDAPGITISPSPFARLFRRTPSFITAAAVL